MAIDIQQIRKDTRGIHNKIFLNSAGSSLMPIGVVDAITEYLQLEEELGGYKTAALKDKSIQQFYEVVAKLIHCSAHNIAYAVSSTDAYAKALSSIPFEEGDCILTTKDDYVSNQIAFISLQKRWNIKVIRVDNLPNNELDIELFEKYIQHYNPKLIAVTHIPTSSGLIQNVQAIGELAQKYDILYLVDACQSVGQIDVNVNEIHCDFLTATGRKFLRGPRGTGFLFVSDKVLERGLYPTFIDSFGSEWISENDFKILEDAKRFEQVEKSIASIIGCTKAIEYALSIGMKNIESHGHSIANKLRTVLGKLSHVKMLDRGINLGNIITFQIPSLGLQATEENLQQNNIFYSVTFKRSAIIDFKEKDVDYAIRFSPHYFNTKEEVDQVVEIIKSLA